MKYRGLLLFITLSLFSQLSWSANTRLSILRPTSSVTHQWEYMPSGEIITQQGLKNKQYPLTILPNVKYVQSELFNIEGCDMAFTARYYVATKSTHALKFELVNENDGVIYSYTNEDPQLNETTMTIGDVAEIGIIDGATKARIRISLSDAYSADEAIFIDELELYSKNGAGIEYIGSDRSRVYVEGRSIVINSDKDSIVEIYSLNGAQVKNNAICIGTNRIEIASGFYIVKLDSAYYKVVMP